MGTISQPPDFLKVLSPDERLQLEKKIYVERKIQFSYEPPEYTLPSDESLKRRLTALPLCLWTSTVVGIYQIAKAFFSLFFVYQDEGRAMILRCYTLLRTYEQALGFALTILDERRGYQLVKRSQFALYCYEELLSPDLFRDAFHTQQEASYATLNDDELKALFPIHTIRTCEKIQNLSKENYEMVCQRLITIHPAYFYLIPDVNALNYSSLSTETLVNLFMQPVVRKNAAGQMEILTPHPFFKLKTTLFNLILVRLLESQELSTLSLPDELIPNIDMDQLSEKALQRLFPDTTPKTRYRFSKLTPAQVTACFSKLNADQISLITFQQRVASRDLDALLDAHLSKMNANVVA